MARLRPFPVFAFCALTLLIWGNRIWLAWTNDDDTLVEKVVWSVPITAFVVVAAVLAIAMLAGVDRSARWFVASVRLFAIATIAYWAIRLPFIWVNEHDLEPSEELGFRVVHTALAVVSWLAAGFALRAVHRTAPVGAPPSAPELA